MLILICLAVLSISCFAYRAFFLSAVDPMEIPVALVGGLSALVLALFSISITLERMSWQATFAEVEAIRATRDAAEVGIEDAAWRMKAAEVNAKLASGRYYNGTVFDIWIPDKIESIKPIE